jgi:hypothetical protein
MPGSTEREATLKFATEGVEQLVGSLDRVIERLERAQAATGGQAGGGGAPVTGAAAPPAGASQVAGAALPSGGPAIFQVQSAIPLQTGGIPTQQQQVLHSQGLYTTSTATGGWRVTPGGVWAPPAYAPSVPSAQAQPPPVYPQAPAAPPAPAQGPAAAPAAQPAQAGPTPTGYGPSGVGPFLSILEYLAYRQTGVLPMGLGYQYLHTAALGGAVGYTINQLTAPLWSIERAYATGMYVTPEAREREMWGYAAPLGMAGGGLVLGVLGAMLGSLIAPGVGTAAGGAIGASLGATLGYGQAQAYAGVRQTELSAAERTRVLAEQMVRQAGLPPWAASGLRARLPGDLPDDEWRLGTEAVQRAVLDRARGLAALASLAPQLATSPDLLFTLRSMQAGAPEVFPDLAGNLAGILGRPAGADVVRRMVAQGTLTPQMLTGQALAYAGAGNVEAVRNLAEALSALQAGQGPEALRRRAEELERWTRSLWNQTAHPGRVGEVEVEVLALREQAARMEPPYQRELEQVRALEQLATTTVRPALQRIELYGTLGQYWGAEAQARAFGLDYGGASRRWAGATGRGEALRQQQATAASRVSELDMLIGAVESSPDYADNIAAQQVVAQYKAQRAALAPVATGYVAARAEMGYYGTLGQAAAVQAGAALMERRTLGLPWAEQLQARRAAELRLGRVYAWFAEQPGVPLEEAAQYRAMAAMQQAQALGTRFEAIEARRIAVEAPARAEYGIAGARMGAATARGEIWGPLFEGLFADMVAAVETQVNAKKREISEKAAEGAGEIVLAPLRAELRALEAQVPSLARQEYEMRYGRLGIPVAAARQVAGAAIGGLFGAGYAYGPELQAGLGYQQQALVAQANLAYQRWQDAVARFGPGSEMALQAQAQYSAVAAEVLAWPAQRLQTWMAGEQRIPAAAMGAGAAIGARERVAYGMLGALPAARQEIAAAYGLAQVAGAAYQQAATQRLGPQVQWELYQGWQQALTSAQSTTLQALAPALPAATEEALAQADFQRAMLTMTWTSRGSLRQTVRQQMGASWQAVQDLAAQRDAAMREARTPEERIRLARMYNDSIRQAWMGIVSAEQQLEQGWQERIISAFWNMPQNANLALEQFNYASAVTRGGAFGRHLGATAAQMPYFERQPLFGTSYAGAGLVNVPLTFMASAFANVTSPPPDALRGGPAGLLGLANAMLQPSGVIESHIHVHVHYPDGSETYHKVYQSVPVNNAFAGRSPAQHGG